MSYLWPRLFLCFIGVLCGCCLGIISLEPASHKNLTSKLRLQTVGIWQRTGCSCPLPWCMTIAFSFGAVSIVVEIVFFVVVVRYQPCTIKQSLLLTMASEISPLANCYGPYASPVLHYWPRQDETGWFITHYLFISHNQPLLLWFSMMNLVSPWMLATTAWLIGHYPRVFVLVSLSCPREDQTLQNLLPGVPSVPFGLRGVVGGLQIGVPPNKSWG